MAYLFDNGTDLQRIEVPDGELYYLPSMQLPDRDTVLRRLISEVPWRQEHVVVWGKRHLQPRLVAWYGDRKRVYTYSGIRLEPLPWTELLTEIKRRVEEVATVEFNSVLLNYYRDGNDRMGLHSDDEPELGKRPVIASVSLGEERTFVLKHKTRKDVSPVRLRLASGSLFLMKGETQQHWKHGIDRQAGPCGPRVNLTFRRIL